MQIEIITKSDIQSLEEKINELVAIAAAHEAKGLGKVLTTKELSDRLKVSTKTVNKWREDRLIDYARVNNTILYTEKAVLEFLAVHSIKRKNSLANRLKSSNNG